jgi:hypothetical protein
MGGLHNHNPGFSWYLACGRHEGDGFRVTEFVRCNRKCGAAIKRAVKLHGDAAAMYYRPTNTFTKPADWATSK